MSHRRHILSLLLFLVFLVPVSSAYARKANPSPTNGHTKIQANVLAQQIGLILADPTVAHAHWGISVTTMGGTQVYSINDGQYFMPASTAKMLTTAAAFALLPTSTATYTTNVVTSGTGDANGQLQGDLVLLGSGDPTLSGRSYPYSAKTERPNPPLQAIAILADQIARAGVSSISGDIVGDDTFFLDERYGSGWGWDDLTWSYGAPVSALTVNDNVAYLNLLPDPAHPSTTIVSWNPPTNYYAVANSMILASPNSKPQPGLERIPGSQTIRTWGTAPNQQQNVGFHAALAIEDPALYAARSLKQLLEERGITISGTARATHRVSTGTTSFLEESRQVLALRPVSLTTIAAPTNGRRVLASYTSGSLVEDLVVTNKVSQNLHAELMLRVLGRLCANDGSFAQGTRVVRQFLLNAGVREDDFTFYDGSGLSPFDLITPRAITKLLAYAAQQPWGQAWRNTFPIAGEDGTLAGRFLNSPLRNRVFAKTGTLNEVNALSGYFIAHSGQTLAFSIFVNNHRPASEAEIQALDRILEVLAAAN
jgi:serine-type D-Ala-D-Ala carboxypeptidase/endopeptidase (penicillin-binding protein 4)